MPHEPLPGSEDLAAVEKSRLRDRAAAMESLGLSGLPSAVCVVPKVKDGHHLPVASDLRALALDVAGERSASGLPSRR